MRSDLVTALLLVAAIAPPIAGAQQNPERVVEDLNREAMEAYNALDINKAGAMLEEALRVGYQAGVAPGLLASTHVNLGVVYVGGVGDQDAGLNSFLQALCIDPAAQLDPLTSTPDIQNVFNVAVQRARAAAAVRPAAGPRRGPGSRRSKPPCRRRPTKRSRTTLHPSNSARRRFHCTSRSTRSRAPRRSCWSTRASA